MLNDVAGIRIKGKCFDSFVDFKLFPNPRCRVSMVYGRNGAGKSTICSGFKSIAALESDESDDKVEGILINEKLEEVQLSKDEKVFIFDEDYVENNIKISPDGLGAIVLLGDLISNQKIVEDLEDEIKKQNNVIEGLKKTLLEYNSDGNKDPDKQIKKLKELIKSYIDSLDFSTTKERKTPITAQFVVDLCRNTPPESEEYLKSEEKRLCELLFKTQKGSQRYTNQIKQVNYDFSISKEDRLLELLDRRLEKRELSDFEKELIDALNKTTLKSLEETQRILKDESIDICPLCHQKIENKHREEVLSVIDAILNKELNEFKQELRNYKLNEINTDYTSFIGLDDTLLAEIGKQKAKCNEIIREYNEKIGLKEESVYEQIEFRRLNLSSEIDNLNALIGQLEEKRLEIENARSTTSTIKHSLWNIQNKLCSKRFQGDFTLYQTYSKDKQSFESNLRTEEAALNKIEEDLRKASSERKNISIAANYINRALAYIFYDKRLTLELVKDKYLLKSRGKPVKPKDISVGERNAIAICYFFSKIFENTEYDKLFTQKELIVLDDPISSFDTGNKMGVISYINNCIIKTVTNNEESKVLIFTHDLYTAYNFKDVITCIEGNKGQIFELKGSGLSDFKNRKGEYEELLLEIFNFAKNNTTNDATFIGNAIRRVIEAFSTFSYKQSFKNIYYKEDFLSVLGEYRDYFNGLTNNIILNSTSHFKDQLLSLDDEGNLFQHFEANEIRETAKDVICILYLLNKHHIKSYIKNKSDIDTIESWLTEIKKRSPC